MRNERREKERVTGVGVGNFVGFVGVHPHSLFAALHDGSGKSLLDSEIDHFPGICAYQILLLIWLRLG